MIFVIFAWHRSRDRVRRSTAIRQWWSSCRCSTRGRSARTSSTAPVASSGQGTGSSCRSIFLPSCCFSRHPFPSSGNNNCSTCGVVNQKHNPAVIRYLTTPPTRRPGGLWTSRRGSGWSEEPGWTSSAGAAARATRPGPSVRYSKSSTAMTSPKDDEPTMTLYLLPLYQNESRIGE